MADKGIDDALNSGAALCQIPVLSREEAGFLFGGPPPGAPPGGDGAPDAPTAAPAPAAGRIRVQANGDCHAAARRVAQDLYRCPDLYQMGGALYVLSVENGHPAITLAKARAVTACVTAVAQFYNAIGDAESDVQPPASVIELLMASKDWPCLPVIERVANGPTLTADNRILTTPGYDVASRTFGAFAHLPSTFTVPAAPTRADAGRAACRLLSLAGDFPFVAPSDLSTWFAAGLTLVCRTVLDRVPGFLFKANRAGTGKSFLVEMITTIANGTPAPPTDYSDNGDKLEKLVSALVKEGKTVANFDNLPNGTVFGNAVVDRLITAPLWQGRILGETRTITAPNMMTVFASGNQPTTNEDTTRRVIPCRLQTELQNPEDRTDIADPDLMDHVTEQRVPHLIDLLTVVAAYVGAGSPPPPESAVLGSFRPWAQLVLGIVHWLKLPCPLEATREQRKALNATAARNVALLAAIDGYLKVKTDRPAHFIASDLAREVNKTTDRPYSGSAQADALAEAFTDLGIPQREPLKIGHYLRGIKGNWFSDEKRRIRLTDDGKTGGVTRWKLDVVTMSDEGQEDSGPGAGGGGPRGDRCDRCDGASTPEQGQTIREFIRSWAQEQGFLPARARSETIAPIAPIAPHPPEAPGIAGDSDTAGPGGMQNRSHLDPADPTSADPAGPPPAADPPGPRWDIAPATPDPTCDLTSAGVGPEDGDGGPVDPDDEPEPDIVAVVGNEFRQVEPNVLEI